MKTVLIYGMTNTPGGIESYILSVIKSLNNKIHFSIVTDFDKAAYEEILKKTMSKFIIYRRKVKTL